MKNLYEKIRHLSLKDAIKLEEKDRQFLALKDLWKSVEKNSIYKRQELIGFYLALIIANSIVCYQLSGKGEDYWEEFSKKSTHFFENGDIENKSNEEKDIINFLTNFLKTCKYNKRFTETKIKRLEKLRPFLKDFYKKEKYYYENMLELRDLLAKTMNQKKYAKTIVFAVKMFSYGARNIFSFIKFPRELFIPIDSRLMNLYEKYKGDYENIEDFYSDLASKLDIPIMHLDGIIWTLYDELMKND